MKENQRITKYVVEFNRYASQVNWGDSALRRRFYNGLPGRIKDEVTKTGKPRSLSDLRRLAQMIDHRYWEQDTEIKRENARKARPSNNPHPSTSNQPSSSNPHKGNNPRTTTTTNKFPPHRGNNPSTSADKPKQAASDLSSKLGKDGKLTSAERARRFANNLCLFCGETGHSVKDCPRTSSNSAKAKARVAKVSDSKPDTPSDSKK